MSETDDITPLELTPTAKKAKTPKDPSPAMPPADPMSSSVWRLAESAMGSMEIATPDGEEFILTVVLKGGLQWQLDCSKAFKEAVDARVEGLRADLAGTAVAHAQADNAQLGDAFELACEENARLTAANEELTAAVARKDAAIEQLKGELATKLAGADLLLDGSAEKIGALQRKFTDVSQEYADSRERVGALSTAVEVLLHVSPDQLCVALERGALCDLVIPFQSKITEMEENLEFFTNLFARAEELGLVEQLLA